VSSPAGNAYPETGTRELWKHEGFGPAGKEKRRLQIHEPHQARGSSGEGRRPRADDRLQQRSSFVSMPTARRATGPRRRREAKNPGGTKRRNTVTMIFPTEPIRAREGD